MCYPHMTFLPKVRNAEREKLSWNEYADSQKLSNNCRIVVPTNIGLGLVFAGQLSRTEESVRRERAIVIEICSKRQLHLTVRRTGFASSQKVWQ